MYILLFVDDFLRLATRVHYCNNHFLVCSRYDLSRYDSVSRYRGLSPVTELLTSRMSAIDAGVYIGRVEALGVRCSSVQRHEMAEIVLDIDHFDLYSLYDQRQT